MFARKMGALKTDGCFCAAEIFHHPTEGSRAASCL
jgi:hypothetical protein